MGELPGGQGLGQGQGQPVRVGQPMAMGESNPAAAIVVAVPQPSSSSSSSSSSSQQQQQQQQQQPAQGTQQQLPQPSATHALLDDDHVTINVMPLIAAITTISGGAEATHPVMGDENNAARQAQAQAQGLSGQGQV